MTHLFRRGAGETNVLAAEVSSGWWRDRIARFYGKRSAFWGELTLVYEDGTSESVCTDETWFAGDASPVRYAGIFDGEDFDADMAKMAADPATQAWWDVVKPLMQPLDDRKEGEFWSDMEEIYHHD